MRRHGLCAAVLVLCFSLAVSFLTGNAPSFNTPLADKVVAAQNASISGNNLTCDAVGDSLTYAWYRRGLLLASEVGRNLVVTAPIEATEASLSGVEYYCVVSSSVFGTISSRTATVRLADFPTTAWTTAATSISIPTYTAGNPAEHIWRVVIPCNPPESAVPTPTVRWEKASNPPGSAFSPITTLSASDTSVSSRFILAPNGGLVIDQPVAADLAFTYRCVVTNAFILRESVSGQTYTLQQNNNLPATSDDSDIEDSIHIYHHNDTLLVERGTTVVVLNVIAPAGGKVIFQVNFSPWDGLTPGLSFSNNYVINYIQEGGTARALIIEESNNGTSTIGVLDTAVMVFVPAYIFAISGPHRVLTGRSQILACYVDAIPPAWLDWYKDHVHLSSGSSATYTILNAQPSDSGMYQCFASNEYGDSMGSISVQVRAPQLTFSEALDREVAFVQGDNVILAVTVRSDLAPNFKWFVRGEELLASDNNETYTVGSRGEGDQDALGLFAYNTTLSIQSINTTYEGQFSVDAVDGDGLWATTCGYVLQERLTTAVSVELFNQPCLLLEQNVTVTLLCVQDGVPRPSVSWSTGNVLIQPSDSNYLIEEGDDLTLTIFNVVAEDNEEYECTAQNQLRDGTMSASVTGELIIPNPICDRCPMKTSVVCSNVAPIVWPVTEIGQEVVVRCPCGPDAGNPVPANVVARRRCQGTYSQGAVWESENCTACEFSMNRQQICSLQEEASVPRVLASLTDISSNFSDATSADITIMVDLLLQLVNTSFTNNSAVADMAEDVQIARNFLVVLDNIQDYDADQLMESNRQNGSLNSALVLIKIITDRLALLQNSSSNETVTIALNNYGVRFVRPLVTIEPFALDVASLISATQNQRNRSGLEAAADSPVSIEATLPGALSNGTLSLVYFLNRVLFPISTDNTVQAGGILSLSMPGVTVTNLSEPFTLNFVKTQAVINTPVDFRKLYGVFWDPTLNDVQGNWSTYGCDIVKDNATHCTIACNHFTSFSMLMDVLPAGDSTRPLPSEVLTTVTYLGCSVSAIALVIVIVTYLGNKKLRENLHLKLLINLSFTLLGLYVTFIVTNSVSSFKETLPSISWLCAILSALLQYFFLGSFIAMAAIAINLYRKLVVVFHADIKLYLPTAIAITWVVPVFIVGFSLAPNYHYYTGEVIMGETIALCRAQSWPFYFGLVLPFALLYVFNLGLFVVIIINFIRRPNVQKTAENAGKFKRLKENFWLTVGLTLLFGLTWVFGFLATGALPIYIAIPFDILFTIFASFHGFFVFAFYCLKSPECRQLWKDWLHCRFSQTKHVRSLNRLKPSSAASTLRGSRSCLPSLTTLNRNVINLFNRNNHMYTESTYTNSHDSSSVMSPPPNSDFDLVYKNETSERQKSAKFDFKEKKEYDFVEMRLQFDDSSSVSSLYFGLDPITGDALINGDFDKTDHDSGVTLLQGDCTVVANKEAEIATTDLGRDVVVWRVKTDSLIESADSGNDGADGTVVMV